MKILLTSLLLFTGGVLCAQIITDITTQDLGEVRKEDKKFVDFKLTNASNEVVKVIGAEEPYGTTVKFSSKTIQPDSSIFVRIKYTPKRKGDFSADIPIRVSSNFQPIILSVKGKAISFNPKESLDSPDFAPMPTAKSENYGLAVKVVDKTTGQPIENAQIDIIWDGVIYKSLESDQEGHAKKELKPDFYYIIASAKGYESAETDVEFSENNTQLIIELGSGQGEIIAQVPAPEPVIETPDTSGQSLQDEEPPVLVKEDTVMETQPEPEPEPEPGPTSPIITSRDLPENIYAPNNIVFLIDVSVSMKQKGKLDLLKASMIELTNLLRNTDKVAIVTYSSRTNIVLQSSPVTDKEKIIDVIKNLEAGGSTSSTKGIKRAYAVLKKNHISNGNNQVFISTDGAFHLQKKDKKLIGIVKRNAKQGNKISVLGIKNQKWTVDNMKEIAKNGQGNYIHIENYENAKSSLVEEVKKQSIIK